MIKSRRIGIIAEDKSDVDVMYELTRKIVDEREFSFASFVGHGSGKLRKKCGSWAQSLVEKGCDDIVIVHDLDRNDERKLREFLEGELLDTVAASTLVLIPIREIEAWLLSDPRTLQSLFRMRTSPKLPRNPESIEDPKRLLSRIVNQHSKSTYVNTVHNKKIAESIALSSLERCGSFMRYPEFIRSSFSDRAVARGD